MATKSEAIGFDLGNTIFRSLKEGTFLDRGALRIIRRLVAERFKSESYIVSKVTPAQKIRALKRLDDEGFYEITGIPRERVFFCEERFEKGPICRDLGITHFVDDRPEVLAHMEFVPNRFLIRGIPEDYLLFKDRLKEVIQVDAWSEIEDRLL